MWILHPQYPNVAVGQRKTGAHYKTKATAANGKPVRTCGYAQQLVEVLIVFIPNVPAMYGDQNGHLKTLDEALLSEFKEEARLTWGTEFLIEVEA